MEEDSLIAESLADLEQATHEVDENDAIDGLNLVEVKVECDQVPIVEAQVKEELKPETPPLSPIVMREAVFRDIGDKKRQSSPESAEKPVWDLELNELKRKYAAAVNGAQKYRSEVDSAKRDVGRMRAVLERELGSSEAVNAALSSKNRDSWKGRAEEISDLKRKLKQAQSSPVSPVSVVVDHRRTAELEHLVESLRTELGETVKLKKALKCRNEELEAQLQRLKQDMKIMLEKDLVNDELIRELRSSSGL